MCSSDIASESEPSSLAEPESEPPLSLSSETAFDSSVPPPLPHAHSSVSPPYPTPLSLSFCPNRRKPPSHPAPSLSHSSVSPLYPTPHLSLFSYPNRRKPPPPPSLSLFLSLSLSLSLPPPPARRFVSSYPPRPRNPNRRPLSAAAEALPPLRYPSVHRGDSVVDNYHGVGVADAYRWLEDPDVEEVKEFVEKEAALTDSVLEQCGERENLMRQVTTLFDHPRYDTPFKRGGKYFYFYNSGLQA